MEMIPFVFKAIKERVSRQAGTRKVRRRIDEHVQGPQESFPIQTNFRTQNQISVEQVALAGTYVVARERTEKKRAAHVRANWTQIFEEAIYSALIIRERIVHALWEHG